MSFLKFNRPIGADALSQQLREDKDVLVIPGTKFGWEGYFRLSSALPEPHLREGLDRLNDLVGQILRA
jgi:aspartate/methionine/tyrosine aminotransferase